MKKKNKAFPMFSNIKKTLFDTAYFPILCILWGNNQIQDATQIYRILCHKNDKYSFTSWIAFLFLPLYLTCILLFGKYVPLSFFSLLLTFAISYIGLAKLFSLFEKIQIANNVPIKTPNAVTISIVIFLFYLFIIYSLRIFTSPDTDNQWEQICTLRYNDWHPLLHTWTIKVFSCIVKNYTFIVIVFIAFFSIVCGWLYSTMIFYQYKPQITFFVIACIVFSPMSMLLLRVLWKDSAIAISMLALSVAMIHIWHTDGMWLFSPWRNSVLFSFLIFYTSFARHNGIFFTIPLLLLLPFTMKKNKIYTSLALIFVNILIIFGYMETKNILANNQIIDKVDEKKRQSDLVGIPLEIIANVFVENPKLFPQNMQNILLKVAPLEVWKRKCSRSLEDIKEEDKWPQVWNDEILTIKKIYALLIRAIQKSPRKSANTFFRVTYLGWDPLRPMVSPEQRWMCHFYAKPCFLQKDLDFFRNIQFRLPFSLLFATPGMLILLLLICATYSFAYYRWKILPFIIPFVAYAYGTVAVSFGYHFRFFYCILISGLPFLFVFINTNDRGYIKQEQFHNKKG